MIACLFKRFKKKLLDPSTPENVTTCNITTTQVCISWNKPNGGNEIDNYTLMWKKQNDPKPLICSTPHYNSTVTYSHTLNDLEPGQKINFSIYANNFAGRSQPVANSFAARKFIVGF